MDKNKIISIIVPVFNEENFLPEVINQLLSWCESEDEIIVSDGGSSDGTVNLCDRVRLVRTKKGRAIQMNEAAKCAKGDVFWFLHADVGISNISRSELLCEGSEKFGAFLILI